MFNVTNKKTLISVFSIFFIMNIVFADPTGGCEMSDDTVFITGEGEVFYNASFDIGGFQWEVDGATVTSVGGGDAADNGFTQSSAGSTVLAFDFGGAYIPAGCGVLTNMVLDGTASSISSIVFSSSAGAAVDVFYIVNPNP